MFRTGCFCDRLCGPCPEARIEILRGLHDSAMAGHNGIHTTACRVQERYWWPGMWGDINNFVTLFRHLPTQSRSKTVALGERPSHRDS